MAFKHVKDEIAEWCGVKNDSDPVFTWGPYEQEDARPHVRRVRIVIEDMSPGEPRRVVLAEMASEGRAATARVKTLVRKAERNRANESKKLPAGKNIAARDPGEEQRPTALADCSTCGAKVPYACSRIGDERMIHGVHVARALAAGVHVPADDRALVRPARAPQTQGQNRKTCVLPLPGQARLFARRVFLALPWEQRDCDACGGRGSLIGVAADELATTCAKCGGKGWRLSKLVPERSLEDVRTDRIWQPVKVPFEHRARWGESVILYRREAEVPGFGLSWVYEAGGPARKEQ